MARLPLNSMIVPASQHTLFMRGFDGNMDKEEIKEFFNKEGGECSFDFYKLSEDRRFLYVALRFESKDVAKDVMARYHDKDVLGSKITISWYKDLRRARQKALDAMRDRRDNRYQNYYKNDHYHSNRRPPMRNPYSNSKSDSRHENRPQRSKSYDEGSEEGEIRNKEDGEEGEEGLNNNNNQEGQSSGTSSRSSSAGSYSRSRSLSGSRTPNSDISRTVSPAALSGGEEVGGAKGVVKENGDIGIKPTPEVEARKVRDGGDRRHTKRSSGNGAAFRKSRSSHQGGSPGGAGNGPDGEVSGDSQGGAGRNDGDHGSRGYHHQQSYKGGGRNYFRQPDGQYFGGRGGGGNRRGGNGPPMPYDRFYRGGGRGGGGDRGNYYHHPPNSYGYKGPRGGGFQRNNYYDDRQPGRHHNRRSWEEQRMGPDGQPYDRRRRDHHRRSSPGPNRRGPSYRSSSRSSSHSSQGSMKSSGSLRRSGSAARRRDSKLNNHKRASQGGTSAASTTTLDMNSTKLGSLFQQQQQQAPAPDFKNTMLTQNGPENAALKARIDEDDLPLAKLIPGAPDGTSVDKVSENPAEKFLAGVLGNLGNAPSGSVGSAGMGSFLPPIKVAPPMATKININLKMMSTTTYASGGTEAKAGVAPPTGNLVPLPSSIWTSTGVTEGSDGDGTVPPSLSATQQYFDPGAAVTYPFANVHSTFNQQQPGMLHQQPQHSLSTSIPSGVPQLSIGGGDDEMTATTPLKQQQQPGLPTPTGSKDKSVLRDAYEKFLDDVNFHHNKGQQQQPAPVKLLPPSSLLTATGPTASTANDQLLEEYDEENGGGDDVKPANEDDWRDDPFSTGSVDKKQRKKQRKGASSSSKKSIKQQSQQQPEIDLANPFAPIIPLSVSGKRGDLHNGGGGDFNQHKDVASLRPAQAPVSMVPREETIIKKRRRHRFEAVENEEGDKTGAGGGPLAGHYFAEKRFPPNTGPNMVASDVKDEDFNSVDDFPEPGFRRRRRSHLGERRTDDGNKRAPHHGTQVGRGVGAGGDDSQLDDYEDEEVVRAPKAVVASFSSGVKRKDRDTSIPKDFDDGEANVSYEDHHTSAAREKNKRRSKRKKSRKDDRSGVGGDEEDDYDNNVNVDNKTALGPHTTAGSESPAAPETYPSDNKFSFKTLEVIDSFKKKIQTAYKQDCIILSGVAKILLNPKSGNSSMGDTLRITTGEKLRGLEQRCIRELSQIFVDIRTAVMTDNFG